MKRANLSGIILLAALTAGPAAAGGSGSPGGDPDLDLNLEVGRSAQPMFVLEADALAGYELTAEVDWTVNGSLVDVESIETEQGSYFELRPLYLQEAAVVCADLSGNLSLHGEPARNVDQQLCVLWLPSDAPVRSMTPSRDLVKPRGLPSLGAHPLPGTR